MKSKISLLVLIGVLLALCLSCLCVWQQAHIIGFKNKLIADQKIQISVLESNAVADAELRTKVVGSYQELVGKFGEAVHSLQDLAVAKDDLHAADQRCIQSAIRLGATAGVGEGRANPWKSYDDAVDAAVATVNNELQKNGAWQSLPK
jgi:hypothetical protein